ncbi:DNA polymerase III subunit chi [Paraglaciecola sp.]|uniref:DNA polymerase III subunit chi n=1 Tax=Paraglaciecola sp. TaxID=1920173 RepID=UPI0030F49D40
MAKVSFYLLDKQATSPTEPAQFSLACLVAARCFRQKQKCVVFCQNKQQAELFDELLWQLPTNSFVPHNLAGEGPPGGAPVEIHWQAPQQFPRAVLINLAEQLPEFHARFKQIYDFVPAEESLKLLARERYKHYRAAGHQLDTQAASSIEEN